jgi:hypothetical protein
MTEKIAVAHALESWIAHARARRVSGSPAACALRLSLPLPRGNAAAFAFAGRPTQVQPLGFWPGTAGPGAPRRVLLLGCGAPAGEELGLSREQPATGAFNGMRVAVRVVARQYAIPLPYEINELAFGCAAGEFGVRLGLLTDEGLNWWQWVTLETVAEGPLCRALRAQGNIPVHFETEADIVPGDQNGLKYPYLHRHNHVRGEVFARCFANGVIELYLRHVNGRFFTEGGDVKGVIPVIGFRGVGDTDWPQTAAPVDGPRQWRWQGATLDLADAARLVGPAAPGRAWREGDLCVYQPYKGVESFGGAQCEAISGDPYYCRAEQRVIPKGMARTVRMVAALGAAPPQVAAFLMPDWWYGACQELASEPFLPVRDEFTAHVAAASEYFKTHRSADCFDDGAVARYAGASYPGGEGEVPYAQMLIAYRAGDAESYHQALRNAYYLADVAVDHALFALRLTAHPAGHHALPHQRVLGLAAAYLETGDPYLLDTAQAVADAAYWWDKLAWPRRAFGRDAAYIRSLICLHRVLGEPLYLRRAREALRRLVAAQLPDGSFGDQGNTTGLHGAVALVVKPWMGCIAVDAMLDYLAVEDDAEIAAAALRFAEWLLRAQVRDGGEACWPYQTGYAGGNTYWPITGQVVHLPTKGAWHVEYLAKILGWASFKTGRPEFYRAWRQSSRAHGLGAINWDHGANKAAQNVPALRSALWEARLTAQGVAVTPRVEIADDLQEATVSAPAGPVRVAARPAPPPQNARKDAEPTCKTRKETD